MDGQLEKKKLEKAKGEPVKNKELCFHGSILVSKHKIEWQWVKGTQVIWYETADMLANRGIDEL